MKKSIVALAVAGLAQTAAGDVVPRTPVELWKDYDPDAGEFREEIVSESTAGGIYSRDSYISAFVLGEEIRVFCKYAVQAGATNAPGLLNVHGWMAMANLDLGYVRDGWAVMSFDYCGQTGNRPHYTRYPERLRYGNMDAKVGYRVKSKTPDGKDITDPRQTDDYLWYAIQRRALSYLLAQKQVDPARIGARGYSYGGTLMWNLGMDPRVKAIVAYFGIGWIDYYRDRGVFMYAVPYVEPPKSPGEELMLSAVSPEAHAPYITAASLWLNGSNDHHGGHERGEQTFKRFKPGVPWAFAHQARGHHDTDKLGDDSKLWLEKYVLGKDVDWPAHPRSEIKLDADGVPELRVTPASPGDIAELNAYYALKDPVSFGRNWRDAKLVREGNTWVAKMPVLTVDDYVFGFANIRYANNIVLSTDFNAAIPAQLGRAVATDTKSDDLSGDASLWSDAGPVEGVGGVKGFRPLNNNWGTSSKQFSDPKWKAPPRAQLSFKFYCTQPQNLLLVVNDGYEAPIEITASEEWQTKVVAAGQLIHRDNKSPLADWSSAAHIRIKPQAGADITQVVFADFKWAVPEPGKPVAAAAGQLCLTREMARKAESFHHLSVDTSWDGHPIRISGRTYKRGLGVHAPSELVYPLDGQHAFFHVVPGPDDAHHGLLEMKILLDGREMYASGKVRSVGFQSQALDLPLAGVTNLTLIVTDGGDGNGGDHASWAEACLGPSGGVAQAAGGR